VGDLTIGLVIALARQLPAMARHVESGGFERVFGRELSQLTIGLIGLGATGRAVARRAAACGMRVVAARHAATGDDPNDVPTLDLDELLRRSYVVSLHVPLTESTRYLIGERELALMPAGSMLVNTARGGVVDEAALLASLRTGHLAGAALDVFEQEPPGRNALIDHPNVIAVPHLGGATVDAFHRTASMAVDNLVTALRG
jgi:phosphoglycerate dehydrogenase-like enzyme